MNLTGTKTVLERDQIRAKGLRAGRSAKIPSGTSEAEAAASTVGVPATNLATIYTAQLNVGNPARPFNLIIDTGSSNTWVGADEENPFRPSGTTKQTGELVEVTYGSGFVLGTVVDDQVAMGDLVISGQTIGSALLSEGFQGVDGIVGIGPTDLTEDTTTAGGTVPTVTDNAFSQGLIPVKEIGISFVPTNSTAAVDTGVTNGQLTFGGIDPSAFTGDITFVPVTSTSPSSEFVGIDQSITFGTANTPVLAQTAGIADTGTTLILIASDAFATYQTLTGGVMDETVGLLSITPAQFANLQSLFFNIGGTAFELTPNAQIFPRTLNTAIGGTADDIFLIVSDLGTESGSGMDFINGFAFLERFFFVWDSGTPRVGFAETPFTFAEIN
ncbi:A1 family peptidase [Phanerochaete sordida]|uniref:A1 family peptidase n=1 Tax=Phanerochaete sordida TaxID=48140 RepID=A0A9P3LKZ3_9APHY|nr:A1 family peptidase [Phanerochaete sordida]